MDKVELQERFKRFALRIMKLADSMPNTLSSKTIAHQIIRSGTSPYANYSAACIAKSDKDFLNKLKMVEEELDETKRWLELIVDGEILPAERMEDIVRENKELVSIITKSIVTMRNKVNSPELKSSK